MRFRHTLFVKLNRADDPWNVAGDHSEIAWCLMANNLMATFQYLLRYCYSLLNFFVFSFKLVFDLLNGLLLNYFLIFIWFFCDICLKICSVLKNQSLLEHEVVQLRKVWVLYLVLLNYVLCSWIINFQDFSGFLNSDSLNLNHINQASSFDLINLYIISFFSRVLITLIIFCMIILIIILIIRAFQVLVIIQLVIKFLFGLFIVSFFHSFKDCFIFILAFIMVNLIFIQHLIILNLV